MLLLNNKYKSFQAECKIMMIDGSVEKCHFPFVYNGILHGECTKYGSSDRHWCSSTPFTKFSTTAGLCPSYCPTEAGDFKTFF